MCFSASASFGSGVVLSMIGIASVRKIENPPQLPLGLFPFLFALQQFSEGFVWLPLTNPSYAGWQNIPIYSFLTFSHIIWPVLIPLSILSLEKDFMRRKILQGLLAAGITLALYHVFCLVFLNVTVRIESHHIQYLIAHPVSLLMAANVFYALSTILPFFISSIKRMWLIGLFIILSYIVTFILYKDYAISVWCYFATFISLMVYLILSGLQKNLRLKMM